MKVKGSCKRNFYRESSHGKQTSLAFDSGACAQEYSGLKLPSPGALAVNDSET